MTHFVYLLQSFYYFIVRVQAKLFHLGGTKDHKSILKEFKNVKTLYDIESEYKIGGKLLQKTIGLFVGIALVLLLGVVYVLSNNQKQAEQVDIEQLSIETHNFNKVLAYENEYMGNNSNTINLFNNLPLSNYRGLVELEPDTFTLVVNYSSSGDEKTVIYNTTAAFVLIKNLEVIDMRFSDQSFVITRENVEQWFGADFDSLIDPAVFKEKVQQSLMENTTTDWIDQYTK